MAIKLTPEQVTDLLPSIQQFVDEEFDVEIGEVKARYLLEYFVKEIAPFAYNQGVQDAETFMRMKLDDVSGTCHEAEQTFWTDKT